AEHLGRSREAMKQQQSRVRGRTGLAIEDVESFDPGGFIQNTLALPAVAPLSSCAAHKSSFSCFLYNRNSSQGLLLLPVATDQAVGRTVVAEAGFGFALKFRNNALR